MRKWQVVGASVFAAAGGTASHAQMSALFQDRSVSGYALGRGFQPPAGPGNVELQETRTAPGFALFDETVNLSASAGLSRGWSLSEQHSTFGPTLVQGVGYSYAAGRRFGLSTDGTGRSNSAFDADVQVLTDGWYHLTVINSAAIDVTAPGQFGGVVLSASFDFRAVGSGTALAAALANQGTPNSGFNGSLFLTAGAYSITASAQAEIVSNSAPSGGAEPHNVRSQFYFALYQVPAPGTITVLGVLGLGAARRRR